MAFKGNKLSALCQNVNVVIDSELTHLVQISRSSITFQCV